MLRASLGLDWSGNEMVRSGDGSEVEPPSPDAAPPSPDPPPPNPETAPPLHCLGSTGAGAKLRATGCRASQPPASGMPMVRITLMELGKRPSHCGNDRAIPPLKDRILIVLTRD